MAPCPTSFFVQAANWRAIPRCVIRLRLPVAGRAEEYLVVDGYKPEMVTGMRVSELAEKMGVNAVEEIARCDADGNEEFAIPTFGLEWQDLTKAGRSEMLASWVIKKDG